MSGVGAVQCPACGQWVPEATRFCGNCGTEVSPSVELYSDPSAQGSLAPVSGQPGAGQLVYGSSIGSAPPGTPIVGPGALPPGVPPLDGGHTIYSGPVVPGAPVSGPVYVVQPAPSSSGIALKIAAIVIGSLVLVAGVALAIVLFTGDRAPPTTTIPTDSAAVDTRKKSSSLVPEPPPTLTVKSSASSVQSGQQLTFEVTADRGASMRTTRVLISSSGGSVPSLEKDGFSETFSWTAPEVTDPNGQDFTVTLEAVTEDGETIKALNTITVRVTPKQVGASLPPDIRKPIEDVYTAMVNGDWATVRARFIVNSFREDGYNMIRGYYLVPSSATANGDGSYSVHTWVVTNEDWSQGHINTFPTAPGAVGGPGQKSGAWCLSFRVRPGGTVTQQGGPLQPAEFVPGYRTAEQAAAFADRPC